MTLAVLCSGQGNQHPHMFDLTGDAPEAAGLFDHAAGLIGRDPRAWVAAAGRDELAGNGIAQVLCALQPLAAAAALADTLPSRRCVAGYSVGELAAWGVAGVIEATGVLDLAIARAHAMDAARRAGHGMLFVRGVDRSQIESLCEGREAALAIVNPGKAFVLGGTRTAIESIAVEARRRGAERVVPIGVEVASHTFLMAGAVPAFRSALFGTRYAGAIGAGVRLMSGIDGTAVQSIAEGLEKLALQVSRTVQWEACLQSCREAGATAFLELGPGRALAEMAVGLFPGTPVRSLDDFRSLRGVRGWLLQTGVCAP